MSPLQKLFGVRAKWPWRRSYEKTRIWFNTGAEDTEYTYGMGFVGFSWKADALKSNQHRRHSSFQLRWPCRESEVKEPAPAKSDNADSGIGGQGSASRHGRTR